MNLKKHILFLLVGICVSCADKSDLAIFGVQGNVKTYTENYYEAVHKFGEWVQGDPFDGFGNMRVTFTSNGAYKSLEFLDENNNLTEKMIPKREGGEIVSELRYNPDGKLIGRMKITFTSDTKIKFQNSDVKEGITSKGVSFLENDRIVRQEITLLDEYPGEERQKIILEFEYDSDGRITSQKQTDQNNVVIFHYTFEYVTFDEHKNWTKRLDYDEEDTKTPRKVVTRTYEYY